MERLEELKNETGLESKKLGMPLFASDEVRNIILREVAAHTAYFTPRYMANIATVAKSYLIDRVAKAKGKIIGLTEADLEGFTFTVEDWERAFAEVSSKYDSEGVKRRDEQLLSFVIKQTRRPYGLVASAAGQTRIFSPAVFAKVVAAETNLVLDDAPGAA